MTKQIGSIIYKDENNNCLKTKEIFSSDEQLSDDCYLSLSKFIEQVLKNLKN